MTVIAPSGPSVPRGRLLVRLSATVSGVALVAAVVSIAFGGDSGLVAVRPLAHPLLYSIVFIAALISTVLATRRWTRAALTVAAIGIGVPILMLTLWRAWGFDEMDSQDQSYRSPDGEHVLIVGSSPSSIDPIWTLRVEETGGVGARYWNLGCINGDFDQLTSVRWITNNELSVTVQAGEKRVVIGADGPGTVDPALRTC